MERGVIFQRNLAIWTWACAGFLALAGPARAQEEPPPAPFPPSRPPEVLEPGIRPDVYLLRNAQGEPVVVPSVEYEAYEQRMREANEAAKDRTPPTLSQLDLLIEPQADYARVAVDAQLRLTAPNPSWLTIPLGLPQLQWIPSNSQLERRDVVAQSNGYLWRVEPGAARERRLQLEALCKMTASNSGNSIRLDLPSTATVVRLRLPKGDWELTASSGGTEVVEPFRTIDDYSVATVRTIGSSLNLVWNRKQERQSLTAVEATSLTKFSSSDDGSQIKAVTTWSLRGPTSLAGKKFTLNLPANGQLRNSASNSPGFSGYRIIRRDSPLERSQEETVPDGKETVPWVLDIEVDESFARTDLDIGLEWQIVGPANPQALSLEAPTIDGVQAHSGTMECIIPRGVVFQWTTNGDARMLRQSPSTDGSSAMVYAFRFASQPAGIVAAWQSLVNRPRMRCIQQVDVREGSMSLQGRLEFLSDPTQLPLLQLEWSEWQIDRITIMPSMLEVDRNSIQVSNEGNRSVLPLNATWFLDTVREKTGGSLPTPSTGMPLEATERPNLSSGPAPNNTTGTAQAGYAIEYTLSQRNGSDSEALQFSLPRVTWLNPDTQQRIARTPPGTLRVQSWVYRFRETDATPAGLIPSNPTPADASTVSTPFRLSYQVAENSSEVLWKTRRSRRPSSTGVAYETTPKINDASITWNHRWMCRSLGGRPDRLTLFVPREMRLLELHVDGHPIALTQPPESLDAQSRYHSISIAIPDPLPDHSNTSDFLITATSESPLNWNDAASMDVQVDLPVVRSPSQEHALIVESSRIGQPDESMGSVSGGTHSVDPEAPRWGGILHKRLPMSEQTLDLESEWVQSILNAIYQRDRYVARFTTPRDFIDIPVASPLRKDLEIVLDGKRVVAVDSPQSADHVRIAIPPKEPTEPHVIEIFTLRSSPDGLLRRIALDSPRLGSNKGSSSLIWQVIVPRTEHLVWSSPELAPLYRWKWKDLFYVRTSERSQPFMEKELGATPQPEIELLQTNQYDLSTLSGNEPLNAWFMPRSLIWLPVATLALLLAMGLSDNSLLGKPWLWIGFLAVWMIFSQWSWDISILVAQTMFAALGMAVAYMLLRWLLNRRARRRSIFVSRSAGGSNPYPSRSPSTQGGGGGSKEASSKAHLHPTVEAQVLEEGS
jgi:hypothetical protein